MKSGQTISDYHPLFLNFGYIFAISMLYIVSVLYSQGAPYTYLFIKLKMTYLGYKKRYSCRDCQTRGSLDYVQTLEYVS